MMLKVNEIYLFKLKLIEKNAKSQTLTRPYLRRLCGVSPFRCLPINRAIHLRPVKQLIKAKCDVRLHVSSHMCDGFDCGDCRSQITLMIYLDEI